MDPYLESSRFWHTVHTHLIVKTCEALQPLLLPNYVASSEDKVILKQRERSREPDVTIRETEARSRGAVATMVRRDVEAAVPELIEYPELSYPQRFVSIRDS